jgi:hypothetical protein
LGEFTKKIGTIHPLWPPAGKEERLESIEMSEDSREDMTRYDHLELRCPRLGGEVVFEYCRREGGDLPCPRILSCWSSFFPVEAYLRGAISGEDWDRFNSRTAKDKVSTLIELIEQAKKRRP